LVQHLGKAHFAAGRYDEAASCVERALQRRSMSGSDPSLVASSQIALDEARRRTRHASTRQRSAWHPLRAVRYQRPVTPSASSEFTGTRDTSSGSPCPRTTPEYHGCDDPPLPLPSAGERGHRALRPRDRNERHRPAPGASWASPIDRLPPAPKRTPGAVGASLANPLANDTPAPDAGHDQGVCAPQAWRWDHTAMPLSEAKAHVSDLWRNRQQPADRRSTPLPGPSRQCRRGDLNLPNRSGRERHEAASMAAELQLYPTAGLNLPLAAARHPALPLASR
jgi:hypothetical protein